MALPPCSLCEQYEAAMLLTIFPDGDTLSPCANCAPGFLLTMAASAVEGMDPQEAQSHAEAIGRIAAALPATPQPSKPAGKRTGRSAAKSEPADTQALEGGTQDPLIDECPNCGDMVEVTQGGEYNCPNCTPLTISATASQ